MKKISLILSILLIAFILGSSTFSIASAEEYSSAEEILNEEEPIESEFETRNPTEISTKRPKLSTPDGLTVDGKYLSWNPGSNISSYQIRIAGLDRTTRTVIDKYYKAKGEHSYFLLPELNEGEYFLLVKAKSNNYEYSNSDWAVFEYRIGVEASDEPFVDCHGNWEGVFIIFESTEETEGLEATYCLTCLKTYVLRRAAIPSEGQLTFQLINGETEYAVRAHNEYTEKAYEEVAIPAYHRGKPVTQIESFGFYRMLNLKTVVIPNTINKIEYGAFSNCPIFRLFTLTTVTPIINLKRVV